jgi:hypothetical protein
MARGVRWHWAAAVAGTAGMPWCLAVGGWDLAGGHWAGAGLMAACTAVNGWTARTNWRAVGRERHRPDYTRIAELERELGLIKPLPRCSCSRCRITPRPDLTPLIELTRSWITKAGPSTHTGTFDEYMQQQHRQQHPDE